MGKSVLSGVVLVGVLLCIGCGPPSPQEIMAKVQVGMSMSDVESNVGKPNEVVRGRTKGAEVWFYNYSQGHFVAVSFSKGKVMSVDENKPSQAL